MADPDAGKIYKAVFEEYDDDDDTSKSLRLSIKTSDPDNDTDIVYKFADDRFKAKRTDDYYQVTLNLEGGIHCTISIPTKEMIATRDLGCMETSRTVAIPSVFSGRLTADAHKQLMEHWFPAEMDVSALQKVKIPKGQTDAISFDEIADGTVMADFHGERERHRYYTKTTYDSLSNPKKNPHTRALIDSTDVSFYIAELDESLPVQGGRKRRRTRRNRKTKSRRN